MSEFYYLRNLVSSYGYTPGGWPADGRLSYKSDRSCDRVWAPTSTTDAQVFTIYGDGEGQDLRLIYAWYTQRGEWPVPDDTYEHWQHAPLILRLDYDWGVRLGGLGPGYQEPSAYKWTMKTYDNAIDPRDPSGDATINFVTFSPQGHPDWWLGLDGTATNPSIADPGRPVGVRKDPCNPPSGWPLGTECWWILESAPNPEMVGPLRGKKMAKA